jgi:hypothetical protein
MLIASNDNKSVTIDPVNIRQKVRHYYLELGLSDDVARFFSTTYMEKLAMMVDFDPQTPIRFHCCQELGDEPSLHAVVEAYARHTTRGNDERFGYAVSIGLSSALFEVSKLRSRGAYAR